MSLESEANKISPPSLGGVARSAGVVESRRSDALPSNWTRAPLSDVAEVNPSKVLPPYGPENDVHFVPMAAVAEEAGGVNVSAKRPLQEVHKGYTQFQEGDIIVAKITPCMENGKLAVVPPLDSGVAYGSTEFHILRPRQGIRPKWIAYFCSQSSFRKEAQRSMTGSAGQLRVPAKWLAEQLLPITSTAEQDRVTAKVEELFSDLDAGVAALERARANLKRYRAAVLKAAVEGKLTEQWRKDHPDVEPASKLLDRILANRRKKWEDAQLAKYAATGKVPPNGWKDKYPDPAKPDTSMLPRLPYSWCWATLSQLGFLDRGKSKHRPRNARFLFGGPYPFIQTGEIREADTFITKYTETYSEEGLRQSRLWPHGTLCITIAANIAETGILAFDACFPDSIVGFLPASENVSVRYVELYLRTMQAKLESLAPATAQKNINLETLQQIAVCMPPISEQLHIVQELDRKLSLAARVVSDIEHSNLRAARLRQAILKRAFEGKLVPQDPNDELASVLLERIRAARAASAPPARNGRGKRIRAA